MNPSSLYVLLVIALILPSSIRLTETVKEATTDAVPAAVVPVAQTVTPEQAPKPAIQIDVSSC